MLNIIDWSYDEKKNLLTVKIEDNVGGVLKIFADGKSVQMYTYDVDEPEDVEGVYINTFSLQRNNVVRPIVDWNGLRFYLIFYDVVGGGNGIYAPLDCGHVVFTSNFKEFYFGAQKLPSELVRVDVIKTLASGRIGKYYYAGSTKNGDLVFLSFEDDKIFECKIKMAELLDFMNGRIDCEKTLIKEFGEPIDEVKYQYPRSFSIRFGDKWIDLDLKKGLFLYRGLMYYDSDGTKPSDLDFSDFAFVYEVYKTDYYIDIKEGSESFVASVTWNWISENFFAPRERLVKFFETLEIEELFPWLGEVKNFESTVEVDGKTIDLRGIGLSTAGYLVSVPFIEGLYLLLIPFDYSGDAPLKMSIKDVPREMIIEEVIPFPVFTDVGVKHVGGGLFGSMYFVEYDNGATIFLSKTEDGYLLEVYYSDKSYEIELSSVEELFALNEFEELMTTIMLI